MDTEEGFHKSSTPAKNSNSQSQDGLSPNPAVEARFPDFCQNRLSLDDNILKQALQLFNESKHLLLANLSAIGNGTPKEAERYWFAFTLFSVKRLSVKEPNNSNLGTDANGFTLCQILRSAKLNVVDFFKELPQFIVKVGPLLSEHYGIYWEKRLEAKELQANFVHLSLLSKL